MGVKKINPVNKFVLFLLLLLVVLFFSVWQLARHNKILQNLLKPPKKSKEGEEGISSMVKSLTYIFQCACFVFDISMYHPPISLWHGR